MLASISLVVGETKALVLEPNRLVNVSLVSYSFYSLFFFFCLKESFAFWAAPALRDFVDDLKQRSIGAELAELAELASSVS